MKLFAKDLLKQWLRQLLTTLREQLAALGADGKYIVEAGDHSATE